MVAEVFGFWVTGKDGQEIISKRQEIAVAVSKAGGGMQVVSEYSQYGKGGSPLIARWMRVNGPEEAIRDIVSDFGVQAIQQAPNGTDIPRFLA